MLSGRKTLRESRCCQTIVLAIACTLRLAAQTAQIALPAQPIQTSGTAVVPVHFSVAGASVSAIQFDVSFDNSALSITSTPGQSLSAALKSLYPVSVNPSKERFLIAGLDETAIPDGTLLNLIVNVAPDAAAKDYTLTVSNAFASAPDGESVEVSGVNGTISVQPGERTVLGSNSVLNAASLQGAGVAPGEVVTLFGSGFRPNSTGRISDTSVSFNDIPSPLLHAAPTQINAVVPYAVTGSTVQIQVSYLNQKLGEVTVPVLTAAPGIFSANGTGVGQGAILNQDSTVNSPLHPAARGSIVMIYGTGAGPMHPPLQDGQIAPVSPLSSLISTVSVTIGGINAPVIYAGSAPGLVTGIFQINCKVPEGVSSGLSIPIVVQVGKTSSQAGMILAIK
jgi:uncharacterized protein (TIGR03437 family)